MAYPEESARADVEAWNAELGNNQSFPSDKIDRRISESLNGADNWILIGGPPCQAYSIAGRSRVIPVDPEKYEKDQRHFLYKAYLRIIAEHRPSLFVMENVKGILTSEVAGKRIIDRILSDLREPMPASRSGNGSGKENNGVEYRIYPLADYDGSGKLFDSEPADYIIRTEEHRIPQARHRLILLGVRNDLLTSSIHVGKLRTYEERVKMWTAIKDLPKVRSRLSNGSDSGTNWAQAVRAMKSEGILSDPAVDSQVRAAIRSKLLKLSDGLPTGTDFTEWNCRPEFPARVVPRCSSRRSV